MVKKIDHIGIAVNSIEDVLKFYTGYLEIECIQIEEVPTQKVKTAMLPVGDIKIELIEPTEDDSPVAIFLSKSGEGIHHIAYEVDDIDSCLKKAKETGLKLINQVPVPGAGNKLISFLHPSSTFGVLTEICMIKKPKNSHL